MITLPFYEDDNFSYTILLDDRQYGLTFRWNSRCELWTLTIADSIGTVLIDGVKLSLSAENIQMYQHLTGITGRLLIVSQNNSAVISHDSFINGDISLVYVSEGE